MFVVPHKNFDQTLHILHQNLKFVINPCKFVYPFAIIQWKNSILA